LQLLYISWAASLTVRTHLPSWSLFVSCTNAAKTQQVMQTLPYFIQSHLLPKLAMLQVTCCDPKSMAIIECALRSNQIVHVMLSTANEH